MARTRSAFFFVYDQPSTARMNVIAQYWRSSGPLSFPPRGRHVSSGALADQFPLELRERQQDVQRQPAQRRAGVELLRGCDETYLVLLEDAQHPGEVQQRSAEPVATTTAWSSLVNAGRSTSS
jgi:hypothetical protein